jgi:uncharacterized protein YkwD
MPRGIRSLLLLAAVALLAAPAAHAGSRDSSLEQSVLRQINTVRRDHGLQPLAFSSKLTAAALEHTNEMGADGYFAHESLDHSVFWKRVRRWYPSSGQSFWTVGENLLWSSPDIGPAGAVTMWMNSPEHRANLLSPSWHEIGLSAVHFDSAPGTFGSRAVTIITADFGARH